MLQVVIIAGDGQLQDIINAIASIDGLRVMASVSSNPDVASMLVAARAAASTNINPPTQ